MSTAEDFSYYRVNGLSMRDVEQWMRRRHYTRIDFQGQDFRTSTFWGNKEIFYKITFQSDLDVFYREGSLGGLIVMEIQMSSDSIGIRGYCPWLLFGLMNIKWSFKHNPVSWMKYRKEGYEDLSALNRWLDQSGS